MDIKCPPNTLGNFSKVKPNNKGIPKRKGPRMKPYLNLALPYGNVRWNHTIDGPLSPKKVIYKKYDRYVVSWNLDDIFWKS